jgi:hypothetical protein
MTAVEVLARSERFELPTLGFEVRCSIQLSYERFRAHNSRECRESQPRSRCAAAFLPGFSTT